MKQLPPNVSPYKRTPEFDRRSIPAGLRSSHNTKAGVWAKIVVLEGRLKYSILEPTLEERILDQSTHGIVEPTIRHEVEPLDEVRFYVEFYR